MAMAVVVASALAAVASAAVAPEVAPEGCSLFAGVNLVGPSVHPDVPVLVDSADECCQACRAHRGKEIEQSERCNVWTYHAPSRACQLKNRADDAAAIDDAAFDSGRVCSPPCRSDEYQAVACGVATDRVCRRCSAPHTCAEGYYEAEACAATRDRVCRRCSQCHATAGHEEDDPPCLRECDPAAAVRGQASALPPGCAVGNYRNDDEAVAPWVVGCPGYSRCRPGMWCDGVAQTPCAPGRYGATAGLATAECSGPCGEGYFCTGAYDSLTQLTFGSVTAREHVCGGVGVFCPAGSSAPTPVADGYYTVGSHLPGGARDAGNVTRSGEAECEPGFYCVGGVKQPCAGGRYGDRRGMTAAACSGVCEAGWFCPAGSTTPRAVECGGELEYCPEGSEAPQPLFVGQNTLSAPYESRNPPEVVPTGGRGGYYTVGDGGQQSVSAPLHRERQLLCPMGHYCVGGEKHACPAGRYGNTAGQVEATCTGVCAVGHYCPPASTDARQVRCGGNGVYCPEGSAAPTPVAVGHYTTGGAERTRWWQTPCEPGHWCVGGERFLCNQGHYGDAYGASHPDCAGVCAAGFYCPKGSTRATQHECGDASVYCPAGSFEPHPVYEGYYTLRVEAGAGVVAAGAFAGVYSHPQGLGQFEDPTLHRLPQATAAVSAADNPVATHIVIDTAAIRTDERLCEEGHYCVGGERFECPVGRWGGARRLHNDSCSGECAAGYVCPSASERPTQVQCGGNDRWCPPGAWEVVPVTPGYYTVGGDASGLTRTGEVECEPGWYCRRGVRIRCPAGRYGATAGLDDDACSGLCEAGFYCPEASTSPQQIACGNETVFCPEGSKEPLSVYPGYYTVGGRNEGIASHAGMHCRWTYGDLDSAPRLRGPGFHLPFDAARYCTSGQIGDADTRATQQLCEVGHFCVGGLRYECPPGTFGNAEGETRPQCSGTCPNGYYCPWASTSKFERECGAANKYCPAPAGAPTPVSRGYYTVTDTLPAVRWRQTICEKGWFCREGERFPCPPGRYGDTQGLYSEQCSGLCAPGYYCPVHSVNRTQVECGHVGVYCPIGSHKPTPVPEGYYTTGGMEMVVGQRENTTRTWFELCEPGHYCTGGIKRQCPARVWGDRAGESSPGCSGVCPAGYFCPPYTRDPFTYECGNISLPVTDESFTADGASVSGGHHGAASVVGPPAAGDPVLVEWDDGVRARVPSAIIDIMSVAAIQTLHLRGGPTSFFCPEGSDWPTPVRQGYYTIGGDIFGHNRTRVEETPCDRGYYCIAGIKAPCPPGTYGSERKLATRKCSGWCPAGFECPEATVDPIECPPNFYSLDGFPQCLECPTPLPPQDPRYPHIRPRCRNSRLCCNY